MTIQKSVVDTPLEDLVLCRAAYFIAVLYHRNENEVRARIGLPPRTYTRMCSTCGKPLVYETYRKTGLCWDCYHKSHHVMVECDNCGAMIDRCIGVLVGRIGREGQQHVFCNKKCQGKWLGERYGRNRKKV